MIVLGRLYTRTLVTTADQAVVRSGPYRVVRHPGYLGSLMAWTGAALVLAPLPIAGLISAVLMLAYLRRVHHEERMLVNRLGSAYAAYRLRTWRLIPFVYELACSPRDVLNVHARSPGFPGGCAIRQPLPRSWRSH